MYAEFETRTSYKYLEKVVSVLQEPICILGGWAVFLQVNTNFQKAQGRPYLGSRDIDLGFHFDKNITAEQMKKSSLAKSIELLQQKLKFKPISFRLLKEFHTETEEEIAEGQIIPAHFVFPMYLDLLVDYIPPNFKEIFHFQPADEPLLRFVFENSEYREELKQFKKKLWLPKPELLLATKIKALKQRDKEHKKRKDICDIFALLWYSTEKPQDLKEKVSCFIPLTKVFSSLSTITQSDYQKASQQVNHSAEEMKRVIGILSS